MLNVLSDTHAKQTAKIISRFEDTIDIANPDIVLVEGDTNTVLGTSIVISKTAIKLGHVEAGLRSFDKTMPEELNRIVCDHLSDILFAPTDIASQNLLNEGIPDEKIFITGNTIVDAVYQNIKIAEKKSDIINTLDINSEFLLLTTHRQENADNKTRLLSIIKGVAQLSRKLGIPAIFPAHPRTVKNLNRFNITIPDNIRIISPLGYLDFLILEKKASLVITDSGGVQEESCILKTPCITVRDNTERPETINVGSNIVVGTLPDNIVENGVKMYNNHKKWINPFGDGKSGERIIKLSIKFLEGVI